MAPVLKGMCANSYNYLMDYFKGLKASIYYINSITTQIPRKHFLHFLCDLLGAIDKTCGYHSVLLLCVCVFFRARLSCLHGQDKAKDPAGAEHILEVVSPGAAVLHELSPLHLTPGLSPRHQQHLLAAEACADQADAQPHIEHQHQE